MKKILLVVISALSITNCSGYEFTHAFVANVISDYCISSPIDQEIIKLSLLEFLKPNKIIIECSHEN